MYPWMMGLGIVLSALFWIRHSRRDTRLLWIYWAALFGAFAGAKAVYWAAEGFLQWNAPDRWLQWATGKSVLGALLGGYVSVELAKRSLQYPHATGDLFAATVPLGIALGRWGCWSAGCCQGQVCQPAWYTLVDAQGHHRWPSVPLELGFNLLALGVFGLLRRLGRLPGQHFHLYLIGYGCFRFLHETVRDTPRLMGQVSGYQIVCLILVVMGVVGFELRRAKRADSYAAQG
jgi:phosphatidylglycerol:prolipoprotein diacylglycerol transferase